MTKLPAKFMHKFALFFWPDTKLIKLENNKLDFNLYNLSNLSYSIV